MSLSIAVGSAIRSIGASLSRSSSSRRAATSSSDTETFSEGDASNRSPLSGCEPSVPGGNAGEGSEFPGVLTAIRVRPLSSAEIASGARLALTYGGPGGGFRITEALLPAVVVSERFFLFDHNFWSVEPASVPNASGGRSTSATDFAPAKQAQLYEALGRPLLDACINGYNAALFAYGA
jgi:hypothetical protein